ncbi:MAG: uroporphyrinogen-III synthase, partial [Armatimonadetes bacterium]|nr:uroporphyrinogen-III synthase [Armatimonadota bacterium]
ELDGKRILIPRALEAREVLPQKLEDRGAQVDVVPVYRTVLDDSGAELIKGKLQAGEVDIVTFTSSSTVKNFVKLVGEEIVRDRMRQVCIACIGPITAETAESFGMQVDVLAEEFTTEGLMDALVRYLASE